MNDSYFRREPGSSRFDPESAPNHAALGNACARSGEWAEAAAAFGRAVDRAPEFHYYGYARATLQLWVGDVEGYGRDCGALTDRFDKTDIPSTRR